MIFHHHQHNVAYRSKSIWSCLGCFWFNWWLIVWLQIGILNSRQGGVECRRHFWGDSIHCPLLCSVFVTIICTGFQHKESLISASRQDLFNSVSIHKKRGNGKSSPSQEVPDLNSLHRTVTLEIILGIDRSRLFYGNQASYISSCAPKEPPPPPPLAYFGLKVCPLGPPRAPHRPHWAPQ